MMRSSFRSRAFTRPICSVSDAPLADLRLAGIEGQRAGVQIELALLEGKHFGLHSPPERVRDRHSHLEIIREPAPDGREGVPLEKALPRRRLLELAKHRFPSEPVVLVRQFQHPAEHRELAVDAAVAGPLPLPVERIGFTVVRADGREPAPLEVAVQMGQR